MDPNHIRNLAIVGHAKSGKTSLADAILYETKMTPRLGKVDDSSSLSDYNPDEIERKSSINASLLYADYKGCRIYIVDTPGYMDFIGEILPALTVVDAAIVVIDAIDGIGVGTEKAWEHLEARNLPRAIFLSKSDKEGANVDAQVAAIRKHFSERCVVYKNSITEDTAFVEAIAAINDALLERYLEGGILTEEELIRTLREGVLAGKLIPIVVGSAFEPGAIKHVLDIIVNTFPAPIDNSTIPCLDAATGKEATIQPDPSAPFSAVVFKTIADPYVGQLSIFRVSSGTLKSDTGFYNSTKKLRERIGHTFILQGSQQRQVESLTAGEVGAVMKLKGTQTGDSLSDEKRPVVFKFVDLPAPIISASVKPKTKKDEEKISDALAKLASEDLCFKATWDPQTKEHIISGMGDLHLDIMIGRLRKRFGVDVELGTPKVAYKETIRSSASVQGKYKRQSGGRGQYGDVWLKIEPLERGKGFEFNEDIFGGAIPRNYFPSVEKGVREALNEGVLAGYPIVDIKVTLYDGSYHEVDSSDLAFQIAGSMALKKGVQESNPVLLEPIMDVEVVVPEECMGAITGNLSSHRGRVQGMELRGRMQVLKAKVPQAEMLKYANDLKSLTGGRGMYTMTFSHYEEMPRKLAEAIIEQNRKANEKS